MGHSLDPADTTPQEAHAVRDGFRIDGWRIEPQRYRMVKHERVVQLEPKMMHVLMCLAERPGQVVTRAALMERVWAGTIVGEDLLTRCVSELRKTFGDDPRRPRIIETIRAQGYRLMVPVTVAPSRAASRFSAMTIREAWIGLSLVVGGVVLAGLALNGAFAPAPEAVFTMIPETSYPGLEIHPALSPDGNRVAFIWHKPDEHGDLYVKLLQDETVTRLTETRASEMGPAWSPDGNYLAFMRLGEGTCGIFVMPLIGGRERKLTDCKTALTLELAWSPDGKRVAYSDRETPGAPYYIALVDVETLETRRLTAPAPTDFGDHLPVFSPDGRWLAMVRWTVESDLYLVDVQDGTLRRLTEDQRHLEGLAWSSDGQHLYFVSNRTGPLAIWKMPFRGGEPVRTDIEIDADAVVGLTLADQERRMIYAHLAYDYNIWEQALGDAPGPPPSPSALIASTRWDSNPQFSPDGAHLAFLSNRQGRPGLWVSDQDGTHPRLVAAFDGFYRHTPRWSPDGQQIAFSNESAIFVVAARGGPVRQIVEGASWQVEPAWSRDGRWIYFTSDRSGTRQVWRASPDGAALTQITHTGGTALFVSADDRHLYYLKPDTTGIWQIRLPDGTEALAYPFPYTEAIGDWQATEDGLYFVQQRAGRTVEYFDFTTATLTPVATAPNQILGLSVSPDANRLVYAQPDSRNSDLMLVTYAR